MSRRANNIWKRYEEVSTFLRRSIAAVIYGSNWNLRRKYFKRQWTQFWWLNRKNQKWTFRYFWHSVGIIENNWNYLGEYFNWYWTKLFIYINFRLIDSKTWKIWLFMYIFIFTMIAVSILGMRTLTILIISRD